MRTGAPDDELNWQKLYSMVLSDRFITCRIVSKPFLSDDCFLARAKWYISVKQLANMF